MVVQKDAGELLLFFYDESVNKNKNSVGTQDVLAMTKWNGSRVNHAYTYLNDKSLLNGSGGLGNLNGTQNFFIMCLYPEGINIIENQPEFKKNFGFEVNLGLLRFNWGATEK